MKTRRETMLTSKQAQHNYARFPCQEYNRIFFKGVFRPFLYGWGTPFCVA